MLIIAPQPFYSARGTPFSVYYRTLVTCELGKPADILTYGQGHDVEIPGCRIIRIPAFRFLGAVKTGPSALKLFMDVFMVLWTIGLLIRHRYSVVHAHEEAVFWCRFLKPIFGFRLIYDMHSSLPQQLENFEFTKSRVLLKTFDWLERQAVQASEAVITICPALYEYALTITDEPDKVLLIENSLFDPVKVRVDNTRATSAVDTDRDRPDEWLARYDVARRVVYAGTLEAYQGIDRLLEAFSLAARGRPDICLLIVGGQPPQVARLRALAADLGCSNQVCFTGQVSQTEAQRLTALCGAFVSPRSSGDNTPLKIYQLMASGTPMIATAIHSHTQVLDDSLCLLTGIEAEEIANSILFAVDHPEEMKMRAANARDRYERYYSREIYTEKMQKLLRMVA